MRKVRSCFPIRTCNSPHPPILKAAFLRQPLARKGWEAMTAVQRRNQLLAIFYYQSAEARERRAAKAVEEALRVAKKGGRSSS